MMRIRLLILCLLLTTFSNAQKEANNWFFGENVGLRFNGSSKPSTYTGSLNTLEGCASISDKDGNLLFYSDGTSVWNRNHSLMPNGVNLFGDSSSTQSAIIVPNPGKPNIYYLFTVGSTVNPSGFYYYTVNLNLNNGLGDIEGNPVDLSGNYDGMSWSEKITAVETDTCDSYWIITLFENKYLAYKVDATGVNSTPVTSTVGFDSRVSRGYLKVSPQGTKLAAAHQGKTPKLSGLYLYDFNNETGRVSNEKALFDFKTTGGTEATYGVEFSPNTTKLYTSTIDGIKEYEYKLYQYDLEADDIRSTMTIIHKEIGYRGALQLGPDQKIYVTIPEEYEIGTHFLDVIHNPESKGKSCGFEENYIDFGSRFSMQGLPPFIQSLFVVDEINIVNPYENISLESKNLELCFGNSYTLQGPLISGADYKWTFNDESLPTPNPPNELIVNNGGSDKEGIYKLVIDTYDACDTQLIGEASVSFTTEPSINLNVSLEKCDLYDINATDGITTFDLNNAISLITNNKENDFSAFFYLNAEDAEKDIYNQNSLDPIFNSTIPNQKVIAKAYRKNSYCYSLGEIELIAYINKNLNVEDIGSCEISNSEASFNLSNLKNKLIEDMASSNPVSISFYATLEDALNNKNPLDETFFSSSKKIYFYVEENGICYGSGSFNIEVYTMPEFDQEETILLCNSTLPINLTAPIPIELADNYNYIWSNEESNYHTTINEPQKITLLLIDKTTLCEKFKTFEIIEANTPIITKVDIDTNSNSIRVITNTNIENTYALNDPFGAYQEINMFEDLPSGTHTVYAKNKYECSISAKKFYILGFPKFFTPNGDGFNDVWSVKGLNFEEFSYSDIHIFDRYGKHINTIPPTGTWSGIYNNKFLPSTDYWFSLTITDSENVSSKYRGHFSLIRR